ncbi:UDP-N-acetylmuramoyl-tripeptide--D-alanyl-D-alanine ligase [Candidatus Terasakiella magnetica]|uniref:UDP-N-acetylmuramoyl-tripeptide--D-alanyl-D-alanine ligase n=1 Tax=Candidatus Terasakiella magnetica TaxID=1867952 RepID=A0A1C3RJE2_9PROT|nr:UDP-N-acetylmuramoyl-tripeptide--D-alanyl-D-alanine ligase [Candidatus Terasakiella magnetica]SCA57414.1 UDP-N-acetylmuramoyl-tripeptide--D-alanyl-D-alanine ligase [Candidatus Terasakiella magnetica]
MADILWTAQEAALATDGTPFGDWECTGISIDSRNIEKGDLFIALKGPSFDGHKFVRNALKAGAAAAIVSQVPNDCREDENLLLVKDTTKALEDLGYVARSRSDAKIVAVTGSVGKTGVKEALASVLSKQGKTHATLGNLNNHFGLPLTLARMARDCDFAVLELGMNHAGELSVLSEMAEPDVAVITTIAPAHLENFKSIADIADAKCEIFTGLKKGGCAVINADNEFHSRMMQSSIKHGAGNIYSFGQDHGDFTVIKAEKNQNGSGTHIKADLHGKLIDYTIAHDGTHWVSNSLAVLASVCALDGDIEKAAHDLAHLTQLKGRGAVHNVDLSGGSIRIIDESYNANDASMRAALDVLSHQEGRRIAVLGDMLELGPDEIAIHHGLIDACENIDLVFTCGPLMKHLHDALAQNKRGAHATSADHLAPLVLQAVQPGDVISIKSSRGSRTDLVLDALLDLQPNRT